MLPEPACLKEDPDSVPYRVFPSPKKIEKVISLNLGLERALHKLFSVLATSVTLGKTLTLSGPLFSHL